MKIKITWTIRGMHFEAVTNTISEAYEYVKAIVKAEKTSFPNTEETLSDCMVILAGFLNDGRSHKNHIFSIQKIQ